MTDIIPAILTSDEEELVRIVHILERAGVQRAHLDICDGVFVPTRTITGYEQLHRLTSTLKWDIHLMVQDPERMVDHWWHCQCADRFIVHMEATDMFGDLAAHAHSHDNQLWAAINPDTSPERLDEATGADGVMFMTVVPGAQHRPFEVSALERISVYHAAHAGTPIMVDGGVTPITAPQCVAAGASILVSGSHIVRSPDTAAALAELRRSIGK